MTRAVLWYSLYLFCLAFLEEKIQAKIQNLVPFFTRSPLLRGGEFIPYRGRTFANGYAQARWQVSHYPEGYKRYPRSTKGSQYL